jgi:outer membrane lipoprotein SlyB
MAYFVPLGISQLALAGGASLRIVFIAACIALTACASPEIERTTAFNQMKYEADLNACQRDDPFSVVAEGLGGMVAGSFKGLFYGAYAGAIEGNTPKGAAVGTAVGAVFGFVSGLYKPVAEQREKVEKCLRGKGYRLRQSL